MGQKAELALLMAAPVGVTWLTGSTESKGEQGKHRCGEPFLAGFQGPWPKVAELPVLAYRRFPRTAGTGMIDFLARSWMISASAIDGDYLYGSRRASAADC